MRKLLTIIVLSFSLSGVSAQTVISGSADDINVIKLQQDRYVFAENTDQDEGIAIDNAKTLLADQIESWFASNAERRVAPSIHDAFIIVAKRGQFFRAFAYFDTSPSSESKATASAPVKNNPAPDEVVANVESSIIPSTQEENYNQQEDVKRFSLSNVLRFDQMRTYIDSLEAKGLLIDYGKYATLPESGSCYLVIYDRTGLIRAKLKREHKRYINIETGSLDALANYPGCGAFWFRTFNDVLN